MIETEKDTDFMNGFEIVFIIFAAAFALEEYTASKEHGWTSESSACLRMTLLGKYS